MNAPTIHYIGMCKTMTDGDDALLRLARRRFEALGIGAEVYPSDPERLGALREFLPEGAVSTAHLPYGWNLLNPDDFAAIVACAQVGGLRGFTLHDSRRYTEEREAFLEAARRLGDVLERAPGRPTLFIEYVHSDPLDVYRDKMSWLLDVPCLAPCVDAGHVAVEVCRQELQRRLPNVDQDALEPGTPGLPDIVEEVQGVVEMAREKAVEYVGAFLAMKWEKIHFHCHNVHPLSRLSPWPIRDHLSFLQQIALPFPFRGRRVVDGAFNLAGVGRLHSRLLRGAKKCDVSVMLEIHRQPGRLPLGPDADLFSHWEDLTHAEEMNFHLELIAQSYNVMTGV